MHQKWLNLYDEAVRVPFVVAHTGRFGPTGVQTETLSSHVDLLPTLLGLAGANEVVLRSKLEETHSEVHALVGEDLSGWLRQESTARSARSVYLMTRDNVAEGAEERSLAARRRGARRAAGPALMTLPAYVATNLEALVARHGGRLFKLVRTFDDPACWTEPGVRHLADRTPLGRRYRSDVIPDAWELYDLNQDPAESHNLADEPSSAAAMHTLKAHLAERRRDLTPERNAAWPYVTQPATDTRRAPGRASGEAKVLQRTRRLRATPARVWNELADFGSLSHWFRDATHSSLLSEQREGEGMTRRVQMRGATLVETVVRWEPERELAYVVDGLPPVVRSARNQWTLRPAGNDTDVTLRMEVQPAGIQGKLAYHAVVKRLLAHSLETLLGALAHEVEDATTPRNHPRRGHAG
jgi:uncharacterized protein YndB with AHSA1/START domain